MMAHIFIILKDHQVINNTLFKLIKNHDYISQFSVIQV